MTQGATMPLSGQSGWFWRTPLMQQAVLSRPAAAPILPHPAPPQPLHSTGQHTMPLSFTPSKPGTSFIAHTGPSPALTTTECQRGETEHLSSVSLTHRSRGLSEGAENNARTSQTSRTRNSRGGGIWDVSKADETQQRTTDQNMALSTLLNGTYFPCSRTSLDESLATEVIVGISRVSPQHPPFSAQVIPPSGLLELEDWYEPMFS